MADQLSTGQGSGTQAATANPQTLASGSATQTNSVQPTTSGNLLKSQGGIPLDSTVLPTVDLSAVSQQGQTQAASTTPAAPRHINTTYLVFPVLLFVIAVVAFWLTNRSVKNTTQYL